MHFTETHCFFGYHHGKIQRNQPRYQEENCGRVQVWFILGRDVQMAEGAEHLSASINTLGMSSHRSGRGRVLCPRDERALVRNVCVNPRTKAKVPVKMLAEAGKSHYLQ